MTLNELSQLYYLQGEIEEYKQRITEIENQADVHSPAYGDRVQGGNTDSSIERAAIKIADLKLELAQRVNASLCEEARLTAWINGVNDSYLRRAFYLRFVRGKKWREVADSLGGGNTANGVYMACKRYLDNS